MKPTNSKLTNDVKSLLKQSVIAEATSKVWERFEAALSQLAAESADLLTQYLRGTTVRELSVRHGLTESEINAWLAQAKRELAGHLRNGSQVRQ